MAMIPMRLTFLLSLAVFAGCGGKGVDVIQNTAVQTTSTDPAWYYASVIQIGGEGSTVVSKSINTNSQVEPNQPIIDKNEYDKYIKISYNTPKDIMWLTCGDGYVIDPKSAFSSTGNNIIKEDFGYGIPLSNIKNHLVILCRKFS